MQVGPKLTPGLTFVDRACLLRLKLEYDERLSNFAFNFNLRRYTKVGSSTPVLAEQVVTQRWAGAYIPPLDNST